VPTEWPTDPEKARLLLCGWLNASSSALTPDRALAAELVARRVPSFLLWVEHLSGEENIARRAG